MHLLPSGPTQTSRHDFQTDLVYICISDLLILETSVLHHGGNMETSLQVHYVTDIEQDVADRVFFLSAMLHTDFTELCRWGMSWAAF